MEQFALYELRLEEHVVSIGQGGASWRQVGYAAAGFLVVAPMLTGFFQALVGAKSIGLYWLAWPLLFVMAAAVGVLGWAPAGLWGLPGPPYDWRWTPQDPPLRLDEWLIQWWGWYRKRKILPYT